MSSGCSSQGHCKDLTVISPAIPVVGKIPVTFSLPEPSLDKSLRASNGVYEPQIESMSLKYKSL